MAAASGLSAWLGRRFAICTLYFGDSQFKVLVPLFITQDLSPCMVELITPGLDRSLRVPIGNSDAKAILSASAFDSEESRLMRGELDHAVSHFSVTVIHWCTQRTENHSEVRSDWCGSELVVGHGGGLKRGVNRRYSQPGDRSGAVGGDENSRMIVGEVARRGNVRVDLPTQRCWALHDEIAAGSEQDGKIVDFQDIFLTRIISILIWLFRHNDGLGAWTY